MFSEKEASFSRSPGRRTRCSSSLSGNPRLQGALSPTKYMYLNIKPRNSYKLPPTNKVIAHSNSQHEGLGPGYYSSISTKESGGFQFSTADRFKQTPEEKWKYVLTRRRNLSEEQKSAIKQRIDQNKDLSKYSHQNKINHIQEKRRKREIRSQINRETRKKILEYIKEQKELKYAEKMKKHHYRSLKDNFSKVAKGWLSLYMVSGCAQNIKVAIKRKKELKARTSKSIRWLFWASRAVGRMVIISKQVKRNRAIRAIKPWLKRYALKWLEGKKDYLLDKVLGCIENSMTAKIGLKLMVTWRQKITFIQRQLRQALVSKSLLYEILINRWSAVEAEMVQSRPQSKQKRKKRNSTSPVRLSNPETPKEVKKLYLREEIRKEVKKYHSEMNKYNKECEKIENQLFKEGHISENSIAKYFPLRPTPPKVLSLVDTDRIKVLVSEAGKERHRWRQLLQTQETKTSSFSKITNQ